MSDPREPTRIGPGRLAYMIDVPRLQAKVAELEAELTRLRDKAGCQQRRCPTCDGDGVYGPGSPPCMSCNGHGFHWVFNDQFAAQLAEQRDGEIAALRARVAESEAALRPFVAEAGNITDDMDDVWPAWECDVCITATVGDVKHAAELLRKDGGG